jgi:hypothetical protein
MLEMWRDCLPQDRCSRLRMVLVALELLLVSHLCCMAAASLCHLILNSANGRQSPLPSPEYLNEYGQPHKHSMFVDQVPICDRCGDQPESLGRLEQHGRALKQAQHRKPTPHANSRFLGRISLTTPLDPVSDFHPRDRLKQLDVGPPLPSWMSLLPSNMTLNAPQHSLARRRSSHPHLEAAGTPTPISSPKTSLSLKDYNKHHWRNLSSAHSSKILVTEKGLMPNGTQSRPCSSSLPLIEPKDFSREPLFPTPTFQKSSASQRCPSPVLPLSRAPTKLQKRCLSAASGQSSVPARTDFTVDEHASCNSRPHTLTLDQKIAPARPLFFKELSGFFARRAGRWVLPSRVSEDRLSHFGNSECCSKCGANLASQSVLSLATGSVQRAGICGSCQRDSEIPGGWS